VYGVAFSPPDGRLLASAHGDGTVRLWDVETREADGDPLGGGGDFSVRWVAFSPDGRLLASARGDGNVQLWDVATRATVGNPLPHGDDIVYGVAFSPDGRLLASAGRDGTVRLWDVETRKAFGDPLSGGDRIVYGVSFGPDGLIGSGGEGFFASRRLWIGVDSWVETACQQADRNLSLSEWHNYLGADSPYVRTCAEFPAGDGAPPDAPAAAPVDLLPES
jgi:WD40 repeat protein